MGKIVRFPKASSAPRAGELDAGQIKAVSLPRVSLAGVQAKLWAVVRLPLFLVLYWLRGPVLAMCNLVSVPCLLAFLAGFWLIADTSPHRSIVWFFGSVSFSAFTIVWLYDSLLMRLSPERMMMTM